MRLLDLIPFEYRLAATGALALAMLSAVVGATWQVQDWRHGEYRERLARNHEQALHEQVLAAARSLREQLHERLALEQRLQASEQNHYRDLINARTVQARLRDRLATTDLRLSVVLRAGQPSDTTPDARELVHGTSRAELDPTHAGRIVSITHDGDQGLIALAACQAYVKAALQR